MAEKLSKTRMIVLHRAVMNARAKGKEKMNVRTTAVVDLGGIEMLPASDKARWLATPDSGKDKLTSPMTVYAMEQLLGLLPEQQKQKQQQQAQVATPPAAT